MDIKVHVKGIKGSQAIEDGEHAEALFGAILEVNGHVIDRIEKVTYKFNEDFARVDVTFIPGNLDVWTHGDDSWEELCARAEKDITSIRQADGRSIARHEV